MIRTVIGNLFGQPGMYVSSPGDDLSNPTKNLILDSRFKSLEIHYSGIASLSRSGPVNNTYSFLGNGNFPALNYIPLGYVSLIDNSSDIVTYPAAGEVNGRIPLNLKMQISMSSVSVSYSIGGGNGAFNASFSYVIFRNAA